MPTDSLPLWFAWAATAASLASLLDAARRARWNADASEHLLWALATAALWLAQQMTVVLPNGVSLHFLGSALLTLVLGYPRAVLSIAIAVAASTLEAGDGLHHWGMLLLLEGVLPAWLVWGIVRACRRWLPRNLFVFLLGAGFFGLFLAYALPLLASAALIEATAPSTPRNFWSEIVPYALLLAAGEAWLEGMLATLLVVFAPGAVRLFDERFYLSRTPQG